VKPRTLAALSALSLASFVSLTACGGGESVPDGKAPIVPPPLTSDTSDEPVPTLRLPRDVHAVKEKLDLAIDPDSDGFSGTAEIDVLLDRPRDGVWLHARDLRIGKVTVSTAEKSSVDARWEVKDPSGVGRILFPKEAAAGAVHLSISFDGKWNSGPTGLYRSKQNGSSYALTQFEPIDARRAFPCFDEPDAKIPYEVSLTVPAGLTAITNGPEISRVDKGKNVRVQFAATPPIPSYLVAFAVGPFDVVSAPPVPPNDARPKPLPLRLIAPKGRGGELAYAVAHTGEIVGTLEKYFGIAYPYDKLDLIAAPDMGGAMENAGALMFEEGLLLVNEKTTPIWQLRNFGKVVAHELAHQWFGDLVTMEWWDDLWLNESFATWMEAKAADQWNPKTEAEIDLTAGMSWTMEEDAKSSARAVRQPIRTSDDILNAFDGLTYQKGGAVLGMFERFVGPAVFQKGVHNYLEAHRYKNATTSDFTQAISQAAGRDVDAPMRTFLDVPGVPLLEVQTLCDGVPRLHVKQSRYTPNGSSATADTLWKVPFCARYGGEDKSKTHESCMLIESQEADVPVEGGACPTWVMPNADGVGYYELALDGADVNKLRGAAFSQLGPRERLAYAGALRTGERRGTLEYTDVVSGSLPLLKDPHPQVARTGMDAYDEAYDWLSGTPLQAKVEARAREAVRPLARELGNAPRPGEDVDRGDLRATFLAFLFQEGADPTVRAAFAKQGAALVAGGKVNDGVVDPTLVSLALRSYVRAGGPAEWSTVNHLLDGTQESGLRRRILVALADSADPGSQEKTRALSLDPRLRENEATSPLYDELARPELREAVWQWTKANFDPLAKRLGGDTFGALRLVGLPAGFCDEKHALDVEKFFSPKVAQLAGGPRALAETVEGIRLCATRRDSEEKQMRAYYEGRPSPTRAETAAAAHNDKVTDTPRSN
jgi:alanyl aminopeptidase